MNLPAITPIVLKAWASKFRAAFGGVVFSKTAIATLLERAASTITSLEQSYRIEKDAHRLSTRMLARCMRTMSDTIDQLRNEQHAEREQHKRYIEGVALDLAEKDRTLAQQRELREKFAIEKDTEIEALRMWRVNVTSALAPARPGGTAYVDVPKIIKTLATEKAEAYMLRESLEWERGTNAKRLKLIEELREKVSKFEAQFLEVGRRISDRLERAGKGQISGTLPELFTAYVEERDRVHNRQASRLRAQQAEIEQLTGRTAHQLRLLKQRSEELEKLGKALDAAEERASTQIELLKRERTAKCNELDAAEKHIAILAEQNREPAGNYVRFGPNVSQFRVNRKGKETITIPYVEKLEEEVQRLSTEEHRREQAERNSTFYRGKLREIHEKTRGF
jgi:hypothetical protein